MDRRMFTPKATGWYTKISGALVLIGAATAGLAAFLGTVTVKSDTRSQIERGDTTGLRRA